MKKTYTKYEEITPLEALKLLVENDAKPIDGLAFTDRDTFCEIEPFCDVLIGVNTYHDFHFFGKRSPWKHCARVTEVNPRDVPDGCQPLPEPWLAYVEGSELTAKTLPDHTVWMLCSNGKWVSQFGFYKSWDRRQDRYAIDVRTDFAKQHFPQIVACYDESEWEIDPFEEFLNDENGFYSESYKADLRQAYEFGIKRGMAMLEEK